MNTRDESYSPSSSLQGIISIQVVRQLWYNDDDDGDGVNYNKEKTNIRFITNISTQIKAEMDDNVSGGWVAMNDEEERDLEQELSPLYAWVYN